MRTRVGYWVEKLPDGTYQKRPVTFYFDDAGNLVGMRDPNGNMRGFVTQYSITKNARSYSANACDYFIATVPTERWAWAGPNAVGFFDDFGSFHLLYHSVEDIFRKRADVADYLTREKPTCWSKRPRAVTQATAVESQRSLPEPSREYTPVGVAPKALAATPGGYGLESTGNALADSIAQWMLASAPPGFREIYNLMLAEGKRQEMILKERLAPERYEYYQRLRSQVAMAEASGEISKEAEKEYLKRIYQAMVKEAGLSEEELLRSSPFIPQLTNTLRQVDPRIGQLVEYKWRVEPERREKMQTLLAAVRQLPPEKKARLRSALEKVLSKRALA